MIASCWASERRPGRGPAAQELQAAERAARAGRGGDSISALSQSVDHHAMETVVGQVRGRGDRRLCSAPDVRGRSRGAARSRSAALAAAAPPARSPARAATRAPGRRRARVVPLERRDARVALGSRLDEPLVLEPRERLAHRRAAQPEPARTAPRRAAVSPGASVPSTIASHSVWYAVSRSRCRSIASRCSRNWHFTCQ